MRGMIAIVGLVSVTVAACSTQQSAALFPTGQPLPSNPVAAQPAPASDAIREWCAERNFPQNVENCVQHSTVDPAVVAAQMKQEHEVQAYQAEAAAKTTKARQRGYQPITFDDFKLDGKKLAGSGAKVLMEGFYQKLGDVELLQPNGIAVAVARNRGNDSGIGLLTDDASRDVRKVLLRCSDPMIPLGCPMTVIGHASTCTMTTLVSSKSVACLAVEDGW